MGGGKRANPQHPGSSLAMIGSRYSTEMLNVCLVLWGDPAGRPGLGVAACGFAPVFCFARFGTGH